MAKKSWEWPTGPVVQGEILLKIGEMEFSVIPTPLEYPVYLGTDQTGPTGQ